MDLKATIRNIPDFPKEGIDFKDVTTLLKDPVALRYTIKTLAEAFKDTEVDFVVGPEARGFAIGTPLAYELGVGFIPVRKPNKLPAKVVEKEYQLEYGTDRLQMHRDAIKPGQKVVIADDLLATGGTIKTTIQLIEELGGIVVGTAFVMELTYLKGRDVIKDYEIISLVKY